MIFGAGGGLVRFFGNVLNFKIHSDGYIKANDKQFYTFKTPLNDGDTTTAPAGSFAVTSHATGAGLIFQSNGSAWKIFHGEFAAPINLGTIATTSTTNGYVIAPFAGKLVLAMFSGVDALAQHASNYLTFSLTNLGQDGLGTNAMLLGTDVNTTKTTTGSAIAANTRRDLSLHGTAGNKVVAKGDRLRFTATATGTLNNTITGSNVQLIFQPNI